MVKITCIWSLDVFRSHDQCSIWRLCQHRNWKRLYSIKYLKTNFTLFFVTHIKCPNFVPLLHLHIMPIKYACVLLPVLRHISNVFFSKNIFYCKNTHAYRSKIIVKHATYSPNILSYFSWNTHAYCSRIIGKDATYFWMITFYSYEYPHPIVAESLSHMLCICAYFWQKYCSQRMRIDNGCFKLNLRICMHTLSLFYINTHAYYCRIFVTPATYFFRIQIATGRKYDTYL